MNHPPIWKVPLRLEEVQRRAGSTLSDHLGIVFTEVGDRSLTATMPVDERTVQPLGMLHGGASAALAETVGSAAANYCVDPEEEVCLGLDLNINHLKAVRKGIVKAIASPFHLGRSTQVWEILIYDGEGRLAAVARLTMAVLKRSPSPSGEGKR